MRLLLGISGLGILVGFFLPWIRQTEIINGAAGGSITNVRMLSGLDLIMRGHLSGTPVAWLLLVPALGLLVACVSMLGFRWSGQLAILSALGLIVYAGYILLRTFIGLTGFGLWLVAGSVGTTILSGVITTMIVRTRADRYKSWEKARK